MVSKCRRIAEVVAVMEMAQVGVTTRARAALAMGGASATASAERKPAKRRRINNEELKFSPSSSLVQLNGRSRPDAAIQPDAEERCSSPSADELPSSCCSSNGSFGVDEERIGFVDLEVDSAQVETSTCNCGDGREMSPSNELRAPNSEEVNKPTTEANNTPCISTVQKIMPTELELEEFFAAAENDIQKRFAEKYCYDIVKDVPLLEGRYEWVKIKP